MAHCNDPHGNTSEGHRPGSDDRHPFQPDNCEGYTQAEMDALNAEFWRRWRRWNHRGAWGTLDGAMKAFQNEVARR